MPFVWQQLKGIPKPQFPNDIELNYWNSFELANRVQIYFCGWNKIWDGGFWHLMLIKWLFIPSKWMLFHTELNKCFSYQIKPKNSYRVKYQMATDPAIVMCWQPIKNCIVQNKAIKLYHRVNRIVSSLIYWALVLFGIVSRPELSIHKAK